MTARALKAALLHWWRESRRNGLRILAALGLLLIVSMALVWDTVSAERQQRSQAERADQVIAALHEILELTTGAETGQRGYFITSDTRYLAPYTTARKTYGQSLDRLHLLTADEAPEKRDLAARIAVLTREKFGEMDDSVLLISQDALDEARLRILANRGQVLMEDLRASLITAEALERADTFAAGSRAASAERRIVPGLILLFLLTLAVLGFGLLQVRRTIDAEVRAANAAELGEARDRADLLAHELNHRIGNFFSVILAIVRLTGRNHPEANEAIERIDKRIFALLAAHEITQGKGGKGTSDLTSLAETALAPYNADENSAEVSGEPVHLAEQQAMPLGLLLHELATNAVKYGAWSKPGGRIKVSWSVEKGLVTLSWEESCAFDLVPPQEERKGFGSVLAHNAARQLRGEFERSTGPRGIVVRLTFPAG